MADYSSPSFGSGTIGRPHGETSIAGTPLLVLHRVANGFCVGYPIGVLGSEVRGPNLDKHHNLSHEIAKFFTWTWIVCVNDKCIFD